MAMVEARGSEPVAQKRVIGIDLDDTLLWREVGIRYFGHIRNLTLRPAFPSQTLDEIPQYDHSVYDPKETKLAERVSRVWHSRRTPIPGMAEMIREELASGTEVYAVTGRKASKAWYEMTADQLKAANIQLTETRMTPKGVSGLLSKADSIRELGITDFYEDDRRTVRYLSKLFPHVKFHYVDHGLAHLTEKETTDTNIDVIPIRKLAPPEETKKGSAVRNSKLRELTDFVDPSLEAIYNKYNPKDKIKAWHITLAGVAFSIAGIEVAEHQNRTGKRSIAGTALAITLGLIGATLDLIDGKWARTARNKMTDEEEKAKDEKYGRAEDPFADGVIEAWQGGSAAYTAWKRGDLLGVLLAVARVATTNLPRTAKAIAGIRGHKVPETYSFKNLLNGDIRTFGTSFGRKPLNYGATLVDQAKGIPLQRIEDSLAVSGNAIVTAERIKTLFNGKGELALDDKEIRNAKFSAVVLGLESLAFIVIAGYTGKRLLFGKKRR
ncbi:CDP-alcohol phosphatidyltransferase family protein [Candidatus Daviesbacteria bacterium]|nr:CDP-alcohol phosphatidyltransferase family protein [Candidatus Daviesbacteria bacterium]